MNEKYKKCGWLFVIYGTIVTSLMLVTFQYIRDFSAIPTPYYYVTALIYLLHLSLIICGFLLIQSKHKVHNFMLPLSIITCLNVPLGSFIGGYYLYLRFKISDEN